MTLFVWNAVFVVAKTWKYSTYRYGTSYIRNFDISAYREVHTCVTKCNERLNQPFPFPLSQLIHLFPRKADLLYFVSFWYKKEFVPT